ncbi:hypothetical protein K437DRAFT_294198 [Tilletiaria anomala UBC 951]|uniref:Uncharacterized protein n=1 Tax=Tilletiaria anomala (strain ATCC 24038 / CBS 436.72 / UBC 951) TaxID=1037660 RepID=A0A066W7M8_TILAU|nr:uncharacterized protein K437DRAFT_294198 [Tilletiaria anomala UBC 951]KDN46770.1 hypothetical protein K437DRAFT_294198 [Tilletiaria anomala UBC 951]
MSSVSVAPPSLVLHRRHQGAAQLLCGACFRCEETDSSSLHRSSTRATPKRARSLGCYAVQGQAVTLFNPEDSRFSPLRTFPLDSSETLTAAPLVLITSHGKQAAGSTQAGDLAPEKSPARKGKQQRVKVVLCVDDGSRVQIRIHSFTFLGKTLAETENLDHASHDYSTQSVVSAERISSLLLLSARHVLCRTDQAVYKLFDIDQPSRPPSDLENQEPLSGETVVLEESIVVLGDVDSSMHLITIVAQSDFRLNTKSRQKRGRADRVTKDCHTSGGLQNAAIQIRTLHQPPENECSIGLTIVNSRQVACNLSEVAVAASVHRSGVISILSQSSIHTARLQLDDNDELRLDWQAIRWSEKLDAKPQRGASLLSLNASFLLCNTWAPGGQACSSVWDVELGILVASTTWPLMGSSSANSAGPHQCRLSALRLPGDKVLVECSKEIDTTGLESAIQLLATRVPEESSIKTALDAIAVGDLVIETASAGEAPLDGKQSAILTTLLGFAEAKDATGLDDAFSRWLTEQGISAAIVQSAKRDKGPVPPALLHPGFAAACLHASLQSEPPAERTIRALLAFRVVRGIMPLSGDKVHVLPLLAERCTTPTTCQAIRDVLDLSEADAVRSLGEILRHNSSTTDGADSGTQEALLVIEAIAKASFNRSKLRVAFASEFADRSSRLKLIATLSDAFRGALLSPSPSANTGRANATNAPSPQFATIVQDVVDVLFPAFISGQMPASSLLQLNRRISDEVSLSIALQSLRGPTSAFKQMETDKRRALAESGVHKNGSKQSLKVPSAVTQTGGGLRGASEKLSKRAAAAKASASYGPYTIDRILL